MSTQSLAVALAGTLIASACGPTLEAQDEAAAASLGQEIRGGTLDQGDPAVVALAVKNGQYYEQFCTGTLIGAKTVLTAAHCINAYGAGTFYYVLFGQNADAPTLRVHVKTQVKNPKYRGDAYDFGIMQLDDVVTGITPIEINTTPMSGADVGRTIRHAGFGTTNGQSGSGLKREVTFNVRQVTSTLIESGATGKQTCGGDSGGPAFMTFGGSTVEKVAGVVSFGDENCLQDGWDGRVDVEATWMKTTMDPWEVPTCLDDNKCLAGCTPVDPDCACVADGMCTADCTRPSKDPDCPANCDADGVCATALCPRPDVDCTPEGQMCASANQCRGRVCSSDPQHPTNYCTGNCTANGDCAQSMVCTAGVCRLPQLPEVQPFDTCTEADFCVSGRICNGPTGGISRCVATCVTSTDCSDGATCEGGSSGQRYCRPPATVLSFDPPRINKINEEHPALGGCSSAAGLTSVALLSLLGALKRRRSAR